MKKLTNIIMSLMLVFVPALSVIVISFDTEAKTLASIVKLDDDPPVEEEPEEDEKTCPEGKFLNPKTNRCKNLQDIAETSTGKTITTYDPETGEGTTIKVCNEGYYLNAETNRCNKAKEDTGTSTSSIKTCPEGKELNPETNRCRNIKKNDGASYNLDVPELGDSETKNFVAIGSVLVVTVIGLALIVIQFRKEIMNFVKRVIHRKKA